MEIKNCLNCGHRKGDKCLLGGTYWDIERQFQDVCDRNFSGWIAKPESVKEKKKGLKQWLKELWYGN